MAGGAVGRSLFTGPLVLLVGLVFCASALGANPIQVENAQPGDSFWTAALQDPVGPNPPIEGYAAATSVRPGGTITFRVSTQPVARYRIEISRLGWYGGKGGRRIACLVGAQFDPSCSRDETGVQQPGAPAPDPVTGEVRAAWSDTDVLSVPTAWVSGYYLAVFQLTSGPSAGKTAFTPFVVQAPVGDRSAILVQVPTNTWQAYNSWGGEDFYSTPRAVKVSFDRPYDHRLLFSWEYPLVRFLERGGWDVSYVTDDGVDADPGILLDHALDMTAGHDEYWTKAMRDGWDAARDAGVNLAFMGANTGFWQVRYEDGGRTLVGYKYSPDPYPDPAQWTTQFRWLNPARPECELEGVQFAGTVMYHQYFDYAAAPAVAGDNWFRGSGLTSGSVLPGLVGYETDAIAPGCHVPPLTTLLSYSGPPAAPGQPPVQAASTRYTACSGAEVFAAGSLQFSWGLDSWRDPSLAAAGLPPEPPASAGLQYAMTSALADLTRSHVPPQGPPGICVPTASFNIPPGWLAVGEPVTLQSTAIDQYGQISSQEWNLGQLDIVGATATHTFTAAGLVDITLRVTDTSGAVSTITKVIPVCQCPPAMRALATTSATPCQGVDFGTLRLARGRIRFMPAIGVTRYWIRSYSLELTHDGGTERRLLGSFTATTSGISLPGHTTAPLLIDATTVVAGVPLEEQFVLAPPNGPATISPSTFTAASCDGTAVAQILTPLFGGSRATPLKAELIGRGPATIALIRPGGTIIYHRVVRIKRMSAIVRFPAARLPRGRYQIQLSQAKSTQRGRLVLLAIKV